MAGSGFTCIGSLDARSHGRLSPTGQFQPATQSWSLDWWIGTGDRWYKPAREAAVRQSRSGAGPVVDTRMRIGSADAKARVYAVASKAGSDVVMEISTEAKAPVALAIVMSSAGSSVSIEGSCFVLEGRKVVRFDRPPNSVAEVDGLDDEIADRATEIAIFPLLHGATVRLVVPGDPANPPTSLPDGDAVARGWEAVVERSGRFDFGDDTVSALAASCRARLLLEVPTLPARVAALEPGAGRVLEALATSAGLNDVIGSLQAFAATFPVQLPHGPAAGASVLAGIGRAAARLDDPPACNELVEPSAQLAHLVERSGGREAAFDALVGLARVLRSAGHHEPASELEVKTAGWDGVRADVPEGLDALAEFGQQASESGAFGDDDPTMAARYWLGARRLVLLERPGEIVLLPKFPSAWRGGAVEVHDAVVAGSGSASFAVRWHGYRPALLWDVSALDHTQLTSPALDPQWCTTEGKGEALLAGSSEGLAAVPAPGESFS